VGKNKPGAVCAASADQFAVSHALQQISPAEEEEMRHAESSKITAASCKVASDKIPA
jgi:hypothetical protein